MKNFRPEIILVCLLFLAVLLAFPRSDGKSTYPRNEMVRDQAVLQNMRKGIMPEIGPPSMLGNFNFGPAYYYLLFLVATPLQFSPFAFPVLSIIFFLGTIALSYWVSLQWWHNRYFSLLVTALMALSIFTVEMQQYGSNPNPVPFFAVLFFYSVERLISKTNPTKYVFLLAVSFAIITQLHAVPLVTLPIILAILFLQRKITLDFKDWLLFIELCVLIWYPYVHYEYTHGFSNLRALVEIGVGTNSYAGFIEHIVGYLGFLLAPLVSINTIFDASNYGYVFFGGVTVAAIGFLIIFLYNLRNRSAPILSLDLKPSASVITTIKYWVILPSVVLLLPVGALAGLRIYYYLLLYPVLFFCLALGLSTLYKKGLSVSVYYLLAVYFVFQITQTLWLHSLINSLH